MRGWLGLHRRPRWCDLRTSSNFPRPRSQGVQFRGLFKRCCGSQLPQGPRTRPSPARILRRATGRERGGRTQPRQDRLLARLWGAGTIPRSTLRRTRNDCPGARPAIGRADPRVRCRSKDVAHPGRIWRGAGSIGEDTTDILSTLLGLSTTEIDSLYAEHTVHRTEPFVDPQADAANP
jgi:hypothetical protein